MRRIIYRLLVVPSAIVMIHAHAVAQWEYVGLKGETAYELRAYQGRLYAATSDGVLYRDLSSLDTVWTSVGLQDRIVHTVLPMTYDTILAGVKPLTVSDTTSLFRTTDGGASWHPFQNGFGGDSEFREVFALERISAATDYVLAAGASVIARSFNGGLDWELSFGTWDLFGQGTQFLEMDRSSSGNIWTGGESAILWPIMAVSSDSGTSWREFYPTINGENAINSVAIDPTNPDIVYAGTEGHVIKSTDGGLSWDIVLAPVEYPYFFGLEISQSDPSVIYAAGASNTNAPQPLNLYISRNGGSDWTTSVYQDLTFGGVGDMVVFGTSSMDTVYISTRTRDMTVSEGVFVFRNPLTGNSVGRDGVPVAYFLGQNFPNPFNPSTTLRYGVPVRSHVTLTIYNTLGQRITQFDNKDVQAGTYEQTFDASHLPSGLYFYRMEATSVEDPKKVFVDVKKMVLLR